MSTVTPDSEASRFYEQHRLELRGDPAISEKKMFGTTALCVGGKVFMFPWKDALVLKIPASRVDELLGAGVAELFDPGHGRTSRTWAAVFPAARDRWPALVMEARAFVSG